MPDDYVIQSKIVLERLSHLELKINDLERQVWTASVKLQEGVLTIREAVDIKEAVRNLREDVTTLSTKTTKWEGGGTALYIFIMFVGSFIGWLAHIGVTFR